MFEIAFFGFVSFDGFYSVFSLDTGSGFEQVLECLIVVATDLQNAVAAAATISLHVAFC